MQIYHYDRDNKEFTGIGEATKSPEWKDGDPAEDEYLIPAHATTIAPPDAQTGYARCFINGAWTQVEDHRDTLAYSTTDASVFTITSVGPIQPGYTPLVPCEYPKWENGAWIVDADKKKTAENATIQSQINALNQQRILAYCDNDTATVTTLTTQVNALKVQIQP